MTSERATFFSPYFFPSFYLEYRTSSRGGLETRRNKIIIIIKKKEVSAETPWESDKGPVVSRLQKLTSWKLFVVRFHILSSLTSSTSRKRFGVGGQGRRIISFPFLTPCHSTHRGRANDDLIFGRQRGGGCCAAVPTAGGSSGP